MSHELTIASAVQTAITIWANARTRTGVLRRDAVLTYKANTIRAFLEHAGCHPLEVQPANVLSWQQDLAARGLTHTTIYNMLCQVSSFYTWLGAQVGRDHNPVVAARPKAPKPYQGETVKALSKAEARRLLRL